MSEYKTTCPRCDGPLRIASTRCKYCGDIYKFDTGNDKKEIPLNALLGSIDIVVGLILSIIIYLVNAPIDGELDTIILIMMLIGNFIGISIVRKLSKTEKPVVRAILGLIGGIVGTFVIGIIGGFVLIMVLAGFNF